LAKKRNRHADEIDLTLFQYVQAGDREKAAVPGCGGCHPGGGAFELDRDGLRYDRRLAAEPALAASLDGDYHQSRWDKTGVVEADCFICHLEGYDFAERNRQLKGWNYKWATLAASGIGQVSGYVRDEQVPQITYNQRLFNADGKIALRLEYPPPSKNCVFCHGMSDVKKRGFSWQDPLNHDVHEMQGLACAHCHPGDLEHNFAKGDERVSTVRDDLDGTIRTCRECHLEGYMGAPRPRHSSIRPNHLDRLDCEFCHIPSLGRAGGSGFDVTTGAIVNFATPGADKIGAPFEWQPRFLRGEDGRLEPVNPLLAILYTNKNADGIHYPLFGREIKKAYTRIKDSLPHRPADQPVLQTREEIRTMLLALKQTLAGNARFQAIAPHYHCGGRVYSLTAADAIQVEEDHTWVGHMEAFNINHNVAPATLALGAGGCRDCHSSKAHVFKGPVVTNLAGEDGQPEFTRRGRLFGCTPLAFALNSFHQNYLTPYVSMALFLIVFFLMLHYTGQGPKMIDRGASGEMITRFRLAERWTHLFRMLSFLLLWFTGAIFFYNAVGLSNVFFSSPGQAVVYHWVAGLVFLAATLVSLGLWYRDARWAPYDSQWLRQRGGYLGKHEAEVPAGRLNAGQKIFFWLSFWVSVVMGISGVLLIFKNSLSLSTTCLTSTVHGFVAILFVAIVVAHMYLGTVANPGTFRAIIDGKVSREWARQHHSEWYKGVIPAAASAPDEPPDPGSLPAAGGEPNSG